MAEVLRRLNSDQYFIIFLHFNVFTVHLCLSLYEQNRCTQSVYAKCRIFIFAFLFFFFFAVFFLLDFRFNTELFCSVHVLIQSASNGELKACSRIFTVYISEN